MNYLGIKLGCGKEWCFFLYNEFIQYPHFNNNSNSGYSSQNDNYNNFDDTKSMHTD